MIHIERRLASQLKPIPSVGDLKFGQHFSDHWFSCKFSEQKGWHGFQIEPYGTISLHPAASVFHYGQALFEGMKSFRQQSGDIVLFRPEYNYNRMQEGAARLCLEMPSQEIFMAGLKELLTQDQRWILKDEGASLYIRPTLIGTEPFLGVRPAREILFFILLSPVGNYYSGGREPTRIWVEDAAVRAAPGGLGATKAGANYAASLFSSQNAKKQGYDQVLWLDVNHDGIEEVGTMNVFWVFNNEVVTPALNGSILAGGMRDSVLQILRSEGKAVSERRITMTEVIDKHRRGELVEAFGTGTAVIISPIGELAYKGEKYAINGGKTGPLSLRLAETITRLQRGLDRDKFDWIKPLSLL